MRLEDLYSEAIRETEKNDLQFLNPVSCPQIYLVTPEIRDFYRRLVRGQKFIYRRIQTLDENGIHLELASLLSGLQLSDLQRFDIYSFQENDQAVLQNLCLQEIYLSLLDVEYPDDATGERISAPLFFLEIKLELSDDKYQLSAFNGDPIFNLPLLAKLKDIYDIDLHCNNVTFDIDSLLDEIKVRDVNELLKVQEKPRIISLPLQEESQRWFLIDNREKIFARVSTSLENRVVSDQNINSPINSEDPVLAQLYKNLSLASSAIIKAPNRSVETYIIEQIVADHLLSGKSVAATGKAATVVKALIDEFNLAPLLYQPTDRASIENFYKTDINHRQTSTIGKNAEIYEKYDSLAALQSQVIDLDCDDNPVIFSKLLANYTAYNKVKFCFHIEQYSREDYAADRRFFTRLQTLASLKSRPLSQHPFYGLTSRADEDTYREIMDAINKTIIDLESFIPRLTQLNSADWGYGEIETFIGYQRIAKNFGILKDYHGSYLPYLQIDIADYHPDDLEELIQKYNVSSSTRSAIDINVKPAFWSADLPRLVTESENKKKLGKRAKEQLLDFQKTKDKKNFNYFVRLIKMYIDNEKLLQEQQQKFLAIGLDVSSLDQAMEVQAALEYKQRLLDHARLHDDIDYQNNAFFQKYFADSAWRCHYKDEIFGIVEEGAGELTIDFDNLRNLFDSGEQKDYETLKFSAIIADLERIKNTSYETYLDYYGFIDSLTSISLPLKNVVDDLIIADQTFHHLEIDYFSSIFAAYREIAAKKCLDNEREIRSFSPAWRAHLSSAIAKDLAIKFETTSKNLQEYSNSIAYKAGVREIKKEIYSTDYIQNSAMITKNSVLIDRIHPLRLLDDPNRYQRLVQSDLVIITEWETLTPERLLEIVALGKNFILVTDRDDQTVEIDGRQVLLKTFIPEIEYDGSSLFSEVDYSVLDDHQFNLLEHHANRLGYELKKNFSDSIDYPLALVRPGRLSPDFALFPDLGIKNRQRVIQRVFPVLTSLFSVIPIEFSVLTAALLPKNLLKFAVEPVPILSPVPSSMPVNNSDDREAKSARYHQQLQHLRSTFTKKTQLRSEESFEDEEILSALPLEEIEVKALSGTVARQIEGLVEAHLVIVKDGIYYPADLRHIALHCGVENRFFSEELEQGLLKYLWSFNFLNSEVLKSELAKVLGLSPDDSYFNRCYRAILTKLEREDKIKISDAQQISLYKFL